MSFATKAKAEAGEACRGGAEVGKMTLINKIRGQNSPKQALREVTSVFEADYRERKRNWYVRNIRKGGLASPKRPC
jgi:hypothetical protein